LAEESILSDELLRQLISVGEVDVLVGLPTCNNAKTVGKVVQVIRTGLLKYFPRDRAAIVNADGGSKDETRGLIQAASISDARNSAALHSLRTLHCVSAQYLGTPSSGTALHTIAAAAELLRAKACVIVAPDSSNISPEWIERLLGPVYRGDCDYVTPVYRRHRFEGILVTNLIYPMTRALYGQRVREPYPSEFGVSSRLGAHLMGQEFWRQEAGRAGVELGFTVAAITGGYRLQQCFLGPKGQLEHAPADLVAAMRQTVGTLFWSMGENFNYWSAPHEMQTPATLGPEYEVGTEAVRINRKRLHQIFSSGVVELEPILKSILSLATLEELKLAAARPEDEFKYSNELWVKTVYEFAASYQRAVISRDHIIQAMAPLFRGRMYTFLVENRESSEPEVEQHVEALCQTFERLKPYLLELWQRKEGGP
jgi:glucosylglycerate synthase